MQRHTRWINVEATVVLMVCLFREKLSISHFLFVNFFKSFLLFFCFVSNISSNNDNEREYKTISRQLPTKPIGLASPAHDMCNPWPPWHTPIRRRVLPILSIYTSQSFAILASNRRKEASAKATNRILCRIFPIVFFLPKRKIVFLASFTLSMNFNDERIRLQLILTHTHTH